MTSLPKPMAPAELDLRDFKWMPVDVMVLRDSDFATEASDAGFRAGVMLWCAAWHQVPAGSLPNKEAQLCKLAGLGRDMKSWSEVRDEALHKFVECSDGRFYHPVICEKAIDAAKSMRKRENDENRRSNAARKAALTRWQKEKENQQDECERICDGNAPASPDADAAQCLREYRTVEDRKEDSVRGSVSSARASEATTEKPPPEPDGVGIAEVTPARSEQSTPATQDRIPDEDRIRHETVMKVRSLRFVDKASAPSLVKDLVDHGADPRDLMRCAGECSIGNLTVDDFKSRAAALLPEPIQTAITTNQEASHAQRAKPVHDPIAAAANAARARARGT